MPTLPKDIKNVILDFKAQLKWTSKIAEVNKHIRHMYMGMRREDYKEEDHLAENVWRKIRLMRIKNIKQCQKKHMKWITYPYYYTHKNFNIIFRNEYPLYRHFSTQ